MFSKNIYQSNFSIFNLKCVLIGFAIPNLSLIYICLSEIFKTRNNILEFKPVIDNKIRFCVCGWCCEIQKGYFVVKILNFKKF